MTPMVPIKFNKYRHFGPIQQLSSACIWNVCTSIYDKYYGKKIFTIRSKVQEEIGLAQGYLAIHMYMLPIRVILPTVTSWHHQLSRHRTDNNGTYSNVVTYRLVYVLCVYAYCIHLYGAETWSITKATEKRIDAFDQWCLRRILNITWSECVTNFEVRRRTGQPLLSDTV